MDSPGSFIAAIRAAVAIGTLVPSSAYWDFGELRSSVARRSAAGTLSRPDRLAAMTARSGTGICCGSAITESVCTVMASTVPSLVTIEPRTAGTEIGCIRCCAASVAYRPESMPWICTSRPANTDITNATTSSVRL